MSDRAAILDTINDTWIMRHDTIKAHFRISKQRSNNAIDRYMYQRETNKI